MNEQAANEDLFARFDDCVENVKQRLDRYIDNTDDESIHDVRTAIRRLRTAYAIFPGHCKNESSKRYLQLCREFFQHNSRARDCDVIREKLEAHGLDRHDKLLGLLAAERKQLLKAAMKLARSLKKLKRPRLDIHRNDIEAKYHLQIEKFATRFLQSRPVVLAAEENEEAIHSMRKLAKRLFYLFELDPGLANLDRMIHLKLFQRLSGDLHDCDVAIEFLQDNNALSKRVPELLERERLLRHGLYAEMSGLLTGTDWEDLLRLA